MARFVLRATLSLLALSYGLTQELQGQTIQFSEVSNATGVIWNHVDPGHQMSGGVALFDANGDGWLDILTTGGKTRPGMFRSQNGVSYQDVSATCGIITPPFGQSIMGAFAADVDGDFDLDVFLTADGRNVLYQNNGPFQFSDATAAAGLDGPNTKLWSSCAAFGDYDQDGDLDLFVGNYVAVPSQTTPDLLFNNDGHGHFTDVTAVTGTVNNGTALACQWSDYDQDGDPDLWLGNDLGIIVLPNRLYRNDGPAPGPPLAWSFPDVAPTLNGNAVLYTMGVHGGDYDRDGDFDYYFSSIGRKLLLENTGATGFVDVTASTGTEGTADPYQPGGQTASWGLGFHDYDRDGWIDLYVSHGYIPAPAAVPSSYNDTDVVNHLYRHDGAALTFTNVGATAGIEDTRQGRGVAFGDLDRDGDVDMVQAHTNGSTLVYRNDSPSTHHWLSLETRGRLSNFEGLGAKATAEAGGTQWIREIVRHYSYLSTNSAHAHFGLGTETEVEHLEITWPSGIVQDRFHLDTDQHVAIKEPYLSFDDTSAAPTMISEGNLLLIQPVLRNHTAQPRTGYWFAELRVGAITWIGPIIASSVPANGTFAGAFPIPVPVGVTGGNPIDIELVWNLYDPTLGHDQWQNLITISP